MGVSWGGKYSNLTLRRKNFQVTKQRDDFEQDGENQNKSKNKTKKQQTTTTNTEQDYRLVRGCGLTLILKMGRWKKCLDK